MTSTQRVWISPQAYERLQRELATLRELCTAAAASGDTDENNVALQQGWQARIQQIHDLLVDAAVGEDPPDDGIAEPGMVLTIRYDDTGDIESLPTGCARRRIRRHGGLLHPIPAGRRHRRRTPRRAPDLHSAQWRHTHRHPPQSRAPWHSHVWLHLMARANIENLKYSRAQVIRGGFCPCLALTSPPIPTPTDSARAKSSCGGRSLLHVAAHTFPAGHNHCRGTWRGHACNADRLSDHVDDLVTPNRPLIVDLWGVDFFGADGFRALVRIAEKCQRTGVRWALVTGEAVDRLLAITHSNYRLPIAASVGEALQQLTSTDPARSLAQRITTREFTRC